METKRKQHSTEFKTRVVLDALSGQHTLAELAAKYEIHPEKRMILDPLETIKTDFFYQPADSFGSVSSYPHWA